MVNVFKPQKKGDGSDDLMKAVGVAQTAYGAYNQFGGGSGDGGAMSRRLDQINAENSNAMQSSIFSDSKPAPKSKYGLGYKY